MSVNLDVTGKYQYWLDNMEQDDPGYQELLTLQGKQGELAERFSGELSFGTGGLRGVIGAGSNRMNSLVVRRVSQGLANYLLRHPGQGQAGVVIAFDTRHCSEYFARVTARTLAATGVPVHLFDSFRPTPLLSFAVRYLKAAAGVVITASHNPPDYNGYKVYAPDGGQAVPWLAQKITAEVEALPYDHTEQLPSYQELLDQGKIRLIGREIDQAYLACYDRYPVFKGDPAEAEALKVVYTPLHGTGAPLVRETLERNGFTRLTLVDEQVEPDPEFSTVKTPNPEERSAFDLAVKLAEEKGAELIVATDPDCDRVGVMVKASDGGYLFLNGNQVGALLMEYILSRLSQQGLLPVDGFAVKTVVTGELGKVIAESYGLRVIETLTGFKYIGEQIELAERAGKGTFVFGYEESDGYLAAPFVRDKDGIMGVLLICRMAAYYREQGGLAAALARLYRKYGYYSERLLNFKEPGAEGKQKISRIMDDWRQRAHQAKSLLVAEERVKETIDYLNDQTGLPPENSLKFILEDGSWFCLRPSGTEPKLKAYVAGRGQDLAEAKAKVAQIAGLVEGSVRS